MKGSQDLNFSLAVGPKTLKKTHSQHITKHFDTEACELNLKGDKAFNFSQPAYFRVVESLR